NRNLLRLVPDTFLIFQGVRMSASWTFEHTVEVRASRDDAWAFWSDVENWARIDPAVEWARFDGPFERGSRGETKPVGAPANRWWLVEVEAGKRAVIEVDGPGGVARFSWTFADGGRGGAVLTQAVEVTGERVDEYADVLRGLARGIPPGMETLAAAINGRF